MDELISNYEKNYIIDGIQESIRSDGRSLLDYRPISIEFGVLSGSNGSARVQIGSTDVLVAVKAELNSVEKGEPITNCLKFFVDISANASPKFAGKGGNEMAEEMAKTLHATYDNDLALPDMKKLLLSPTNFWILYVDALILQYDGNAMDAISLGVKAALHDTEICNVVVRPADEGRTLIDMPDEASTWKMDVSMAPLVISANKIGEQCAFDADLLEESCSTSTLYIGIKQIDNMPNKDGNHVVTCIKKIKGGSLEVDSIDEMIEKSVRVAEMLNDALMRKFQNGMDNNSSLSNVFKSIL